MVFKVSRQLFVRSIGTQDIEINAIEPTVYQYNWIDQEVVWVYFKRIMHFISLQLNNTDEFEEL